MKDSWHATGDQIESKKSEMLTRNWEKNTSNGAFTRGQSKTKSGTEGTRSAGSRSFHVLVHIIDFLENMHENEKNAPMRRCTTDPPTDPPMTSAPQNFEYESTKQKFSGSNNQDERKCIATELPEVFSVTEITHKEEKNNYKQQTVHSLILKCAHLKWKLRMKIFHFGFCLRHLCNSCASQIYQC